MAARRRLAGINWMRRTVIAQTGRSRKRADWSLPLPQPLVIPTVMTLKTLADVRRLIEHVPADRRELQTWRHVAGQITAAAWGTVDVADAIVALRMVLMLENVECRPR
jgi:hypothetical protein